MHKRRTNENCDKMRTLGTQTQKIWALEGLCQKGGNPNSGAPKGVAQRGGGPDLEKVRAPRVGARRVGARRVGARRRGGPKFSRFFPLSRSQFRSFLSLSLEVFSWNFGGVCSAGTLKCARQEFSGCRSKKR